MSSGKDVLFFERREWGGWSEYCITDTVWLQTFVLTYLLCLLFVAVVGNISKNVTTQTRIPPPFVCCYAFHFIFISACTVQKVSFSTIIINQAANCTVCILF